MDGRATIPILRGGYGSKSVAGSADVSLTATEAAKRVQKYTGALTGNINVIVPADFVGSGHEWIIDNATSGAFTLTFKGPTGTGIVVTQGHRAHVYADGANMVIAASNLAVDTDVASPATAKAEALIIACSDETTALTTGTGKVAFRMPWAMTLTAIRASLSTAQSSGSIFTVDVNEGGATILSTKITIDNGEKTSTTAAAPPVISDSTLADDAEITVDIDQVGDGTAAGLKIILIGTRA